MPLAPGLTQRSGSAPVVLLAPHGGRRDPVRRPWAAGRLRVNDLHTASLAAELAARLDAPALLNDSHDRNDVDLNRVSAAHERAPWFLHALAALLEATVARHGRATLLVVHGWNVIQPVLDVGLGCTPGSDPFTVDAGAAVSPAFASGAVRPLVEACDARGIVATVGARYPACHRENLLQLFTSRYVADPRPAVRRLADLASSVDAVQLELGIPLRWPGAWRERFLAACTAAAPALASTPPLVPALSSPSPACGTVDAVRFEFTTPTLCGLVNVDPHGGRLLLFPPDGHLVLFTGERLGAGLTGLRVDRARDGVLGISFRGPLLQFPDTTPFLDLETGLAAAHLVDAEIELDFALELPLPSATAGGFGRVAARVRLDAATGRLDGHGFDGPPGGGAPLPRLRAALRLAPDAALAVTVGAQGGDAHGHVFRAGTREEIVRARATFAPAPAPLDSLALVVEGASGARTELRLAAVHRLPVVRGRSAAPVRFEFAACRVTDGPSPASPEAVGWCELGGV